MARFGPKSAQHEREADLAGHAGAVVVEDLAGVAAVDGDGHAGQRGPAAEDEQGRHHSGPGAVAQHLRAGHDQPSQHPGLGQRPEQAGDQAEDEERQSRPYDGDPHPVVRRKRGGQRADQPVAEPDRSRGLDRRQPPAATPGADRPRGVHAGAVDPPGRERGQGEGRQRDRPDPDLHRHAVREQPGPQPEPGDHAGRRVGAVHRLDQRDDDDHRRERHQRGPARGHRRGQGERRSPGGLRRRRAPLHRQSHGFAVGQLNVGVVLGEGWHRCSL